MPQRTLSGVAALLVPATQLFVSSSQFPKSGPRFQVSSFHFAVLGFGLRFVISATLVSSLELSVARIPFQIRLFKV